MDRTKSHLYGREGVMRDIIEGVLGNPPGSFSLVGTKLVGKSFLLNYLTKEDGPLLGAECANWRPPRFADGEQIVAVKIDCDWAEAQQDLLGYLYTRVYAQVVDDAGLTLDNTRLDAQPSPTLRLWQIARQLNEQRYRLVVLMDNFDRAFEQQLIRHDAVDELRPLTLEMALVVATEQPLHDLDRELAASPLFNVMTQLFIGLLAVEAANAWLDDYCREFPALQGMRSELLGLTGTHPFLLRRIGEIIPEMRQLLTPGQELGAEHSELLRLRLAEHGRLLFAMLWRKLQEPPSRIDPVALDRLVRQLARGPLLAGDLPREQMTALNWLINQAMVVYGKRGYRLFTPLFADFLAGRMTPAPGDEANLTEDGGPAQKRAEPSAAAVQMAYLDDDPLYEQLTKTEAALLRYFRANSRALITPEQLLTNVWNRPNATPRRVQEAIRRLRLQLEEITPPVGVIENERGRGYRFIPSIDRG